MRTNGGLFVGFQLPTSAYHALFTCPSKDEKGKGEEAEYR